MFTSPAAGDCRCIQRQPTIRGATGAGMDPGHINRRGAPAEAEVLECPAQLEGGAWRITAARVLRILLTVLTVINFLGPCAAGMWLALHGYRLAVGVGLGFALAVPFLWSWVAFRPSAMLARPLAVRGDRAHPLLVVALGFIATAWQYCVIAAWTFGVFLFFEDRIGFWMPLPMLVWVYGTIMGPLTFMASRDPDISSGPVLALGFALAAFGVVLALYLARAGLPTTVAWLLGLAALAALANSALAGRAAIRQRKASLQNSDDPSALGRDLHEALRH
jgi:hypothetical protein